LGCFEWAILRGQTVSIVLKNRHLISFCKRAQVGREAFNIDRYLHCKQKCLFTFSPYDMPIWRRLHLMFAKLITCFNRKRSFRLLYQPTVDDCWLACDDATRDGS
ncbi:hypothetical protein T05_12600, partial [Trichinella murrelli]